MAEVKRKSSRDSCHISSRNRNDSQNSRKSSTDLEYNELEESINMGVKLQKVKLKDKILPHSSKLSTNKASKHGLRITKTNLNTKRLIRSKKRSILLSEITNCNPVSEQQKRKAKMDEKSNKKFKNDKESCLLKKDIEIDVNQNMKTNTVNDNRSATKTKKKVLKQRCLPYSINTEDSSVESFLPSPVIHNNLMCSDDFENDGQKIVPASTKIKQEIDNLYAYIEKNRGISQFKSSNKSDNKFVKLDNTVKKLLKKSFKVPKSLAGFTPATSKRSSESTTDSSINYLESPNQGDEISLNCLASVSPKTEPCSSENEICEAPCQDDPVAGDNTSLAPASVHGSAENCSTSPCYKEVTTRELIISTQECNLSSKSSPRSHRHSSNIYTMPPTAAILSHSNYASVNSHAAPPPLMSPSESMSPSTPMMPSYLSTPNTSLPDQTHLSSSQIGEVVIPDLLSLCDIGVNVNTLSRSIENNVVFSPNIFLPQITHNARQSANSEVELQLGVHSGMSENTIAYTSSVNAALDNPDSQSHMDESSAGVYNSCESVLPQVIQQIAYKEDSRQNDHLIKCPSNDGDLTHAKLPSSIINEHFICKLCSGYFVEATTIVVCLHTCK